MFSRIDKLKWKWKSVAFPVKKKIRIKILLIHKEMSTTCNDAIHKGLNSVGVIIREYFFFPFFFLLPSKENIKAEQLEGYYPVTWANSTPFKPVESNL